MKSARLLFLFLLLGTWAYGQDLDAINAERLKINQTGMTILGSWAILNLAGGAIMSQRTGGSERYFHQMNAYWNVINLALAGAGLYQAISGDATGLDLAESFQAQNKIEKILLFNTALDLGYMAGGAWMIERSRSMSNNPERLRGFGRSIVMQGAFLFIFDLTLYLIHNQHHSELYQLLSQVTFDGQKIGLIWHF